MATNITNRIAAAERLCAVLGLDANRATSLTIKFGPNGDVVATATIPIDDGDDLHLATSAAVDFIENADPATVTTEEQSNGS